jgi:hypothetical protein
MGRGWCSLREMDGVGQWHDTLMSPCQLIKAPMSPLGVPAGQPRFGSVHSTARLRSAGSHGRSTVKFMPSS